jgi:isoquinoline 1-oxidoreductase beta subunit
VSLASEHEDDNGSGPGDLPVSRRALLAFLVAAPTLMVAARASASILSPPETSDLLDLGDLQDMAAMPTSNLITIVLNTDGTASFAMPRCEVGQGITTSIGMLVAEELDLPLSKVHVTLADSRPELADNQLTGGSNSMRSLYMPVRTAAALAKQQLLATAASQLGVPVSALSVKDGVISAPGGRTRSYGDLAVAAAVTKNQAVAPLPKDPADFTIVGKPYNRVDALAAVTGKKVFTQDIVVPNALPTMICRAPTINGTVVAVKNRAAVLAMPGITHVATIPTGVAVRGRTFGQCIDAIRALKVTWTGGTEDGRTETQVVNQLKAAELPFVPNPVGTTIDNTFTFAFASNSPLETGGAIADVRADSAEIWSCLKVPIAAQEAIAEELGLLTTAVTVHVITGGGSFGRHLFHDAALEAAQASKAFGVPVKLMWARTDDFRAGRTHPMAISRVQATYHGADVLTFQQRHTSVSTDFSHGFGDVVSAKASMVPGANTLALAQTIFEFTANVSYNYGITTQKLNEVDRGFHTGSMRNIYSPDICTAIELTTDQLAKALGSEPYAFRREFLKDDRSRAVLDAVAKKGRWGRKMAPGTAQGIAFHAEYKGVCACLVEIDCTPATVKRKVRDAVTGPRVTKVIFAVDVGFAVNPRGLEAQMQGGIMDGIASALTSSLHLRPGYFAEGSWDNYFYTRQWNVPPQMEIIIMPTTTGTPGGAGEFGVAASKAAVACAYARATGTMPTTFPINHKDPLPFAVLPTVPPVPQSPTDGLTVYS